jgi:hypothetical protein
MIDLLNVIKYANFEKYPWQKEAIEKLSEKLNKLGLLNDDEPWVITFRGKKVFNPDYDLVLNYLKKIWADVSNFKLYHESLVKFIYFEGLGKLGYCHFLSQSLKETDLFHGMIEYGDFDYFKPYADHPDLGNGGSYEQAYKTRGAGAFHTTGTNNYRRLSKIVGDPKILELGATYVAEKYPVVSGQVFWEDNNMTQKVEEIQNLPLGDQCEIITRIINGGTNGFEDRLKYFKDLVALFDKC